MEDEGKTDEIKNINDKENELETINNAASTRPKVPDKSEIQSCSMQTTLNTKDFKYIPGPASTFQVNKITKICLSKSEHAINHTAYDEDFAKSLLLSSVSLAQNLKLTFDKAEHSKAHLNSSNHIPADTTSYEEDNECELITSAPNIMDGNVSVLKTVDDAKDQPEFPINQNCIVVNPSLVSNNLTSSRNESDCQHDIETTINPENESRAIPCKVHRSITNCKKNELKSIRPNLLVVPADSLSSIGSNVCRICMTKGRERLISPCYCKGSMANVHLSCLERWLNQVGRNQCELCGYTYPAIRTPRYTILQALRLWFGNPRNRNHFQSDCLIFWLLSTVTAGLLAVCIIGTQYLVADAVMKPNRIVMDDGIPHRFTETAMDFFMAIVMFGYSLTVYLLWKDHYVMWNRWRCAHVNVRLLLSPDASPVPFVPRTNYCV